MSTLAVAIDPVFLPGSVRHQMHQRKYIRRSYNSTIGSVPRSPSPSNCVFGEQPGTDDAIGRSHGRSNRNNGADLLDRSVIGGSRKSSSRYPNPSCYQNKRQKSHKATVPCGQDATAVTPQRSPLSSQVNRAALPSVPSTAASTAAGSPATVRSSLRYSALNNTYIPQLDSRALLSLDPSFSDIICPSLDVDDSNSPSIDEAYCHQQYKPLPTLALSSSPASFKSSSFLQKLGFASSSITPSVSTPSSPLTSSSEPPILVPTKSMTTRLADRIRTKFQRGSAGRPTDEEHTGATITRSLSQSSLKSSLSRLRSSTSISRIHIRPESITKVVDKKQKRRSAPASSTVVGGGKQITGGLDGHTISTRPVSCHHSRRCPQPPIQDDGFPKESRYRHRQQQQQQQQQSVSADAFDLPVTKTAKVTSAVRFSGTVTVQETYSRIDYDRGSDMDAACARLTPLLGQFIKDELNHFKLHEMDVHEMSRRNTHFFL